MTALKTKAAPQFEVLLKLKQSCNEEFAFLQADNELNLYYIWLKEGGDKNKLSSTHNLKQGAEGKSCEKSSNSGKEINSMGALLGMYSSSSATDESDDDDNYCESISLTVTGEKDIKSKDKAGLEKYSSGSAKDESDDDKNLCESSSLPIIEEKKNSSKDKTDLRMDMTITKITVNAPVTSYGDDNRSGNQGASCQDHQLLSNISNDAITKLDEGQQTKQKNMHKSSSILNTEQKARRLKRAKLMKGHFVLKMMDSKRKNEGT